MEYTSCNWIQHGLNFEPAHLEMCCLRCHVGGGSVILQTGYSGQKINWDEFFQLKQKFIEDNKKGIIDPRCEGCFNLETKEWDESEKYFSYLHFNHWTHCNCNCKYCFTDYKKDFYNTYKHYSVLPIVKDIFENNLFRSGGEITFAGGEPTILAEFEELINFLLDNAEDIKMRIHTSGIKFSPAIARGVSEQKIDVVVSMDAGYPRTYKKIKNQDSFDKVYENSKNYAKAQVDPNQSNVLTKYILFPEYNDSLDEIERWLQLTAKADIRAIILDIEHEWFKIQRNNSSIPAHILEQVEYIKKRAEELNLRIEMYNSARHLEENLDQFPKRNFYPNPYK